MVSMRPFSINIARSTESLHLTEAVRDEDERLRRIVSDGGEHLLGLLLEDRVSDRTDFVEEEHVCIHLHGDGKRESHPHPG